MAVAEMRKLNLVAMAYDKDALLNVLQKTGAADIRTHAETERAVALPAAGEELKEYLAEVEGALEFLSDTVARVVKSDKRFKDEEDILKDGFEVSYSDFMSAKNKKREADALVSELRSLADRIKTLDGDCAKAKRNLAFAEIYSGVKRPLCDFTDAAHTKIRLGTVAANQRENLLKGFEETELAECEVLRVGADNALVLAVYHKSASGAAEGALGGAGFTLCPYSGERTGEQVFADLQSDLNGLYEERKDCEQSVFGLRDKIKLLKIYSDYISFEIEKAETDGKLLATERTFLLEGYVPKSEEERVGEALASFGGAVFYEFSDPAPDDVPPTLLENNAVVRNFETITNMYSAPSSRELDPNAIMAFFYSVFLGFIMADVGYGVLMFFGGGFLWYKSRKRGGTIGSLGGVFAIGGIFTVIWGFLFNSFFGFAALPFRVMPDMTGPEMSWSLAGINVPALLVISMLIGVVQLFAGYLCLAVQCWRRGKVWDGILDGLVWATFSAGAELAIVGFVDQFNLPVLRTVGAITAGVSLLIAVLTAGRKEKLLGKFTKGFGAAYGVINYASDILSYARLYGLMLAGAVIADIITSNSISLIGSGNAAFAVLGVIIMVVGHIFNLAIGLLGAYIHDARLQYVEFYGRFYEGEGELFAPLGSKHKHVYVTSDAAAETE